MILRSFITSSWVVGIATGLISGYVSTLYFQKKELKNAQIDYIYEIYLYLNSIENFCVSDNDPQKRSVINFLNGERHNHLIPKILRSEVLSESQKNIIRDAQKFIDNIHDKLIKNPESVDLQGLGSLRIEILKIYHDHNKN
jgi:hypothetical protein